MILVSILIIAIISAAFVLKSSLGKKAKINKTKVPLSFWDDYNYCLQSIEKMKENDYDRVENMIDNMMYQYVEIIDYTLYIDKLSTLVDAYNRKMKSFLLSNNNLN
jgi:hypothetical protein